MPAAAEPPSLFPPLSGAFSPPARLRCCRLEGRSAQGGEGAAGSRQGGGFPLGAVEGRWSLQAKFVNVHHW